MSEIDSRCYSRYSKGLSIAVIANPKFDKCEDVISFVKHFKGLIILCGNLSQCYEVANEAPLGTFVGIPSLWSDVYEVKMLKDRGALAMGKWLEVGDLCIGGVEAKNVMQCIDMLKKGSCSKPRVVVSTQPLRFGDSLRGWPSAKELCLDLGVQLIVVCGLIGVEGGVRISNEDGCFVVEACCEPITIIEVELSSEGISSVRAKCLETAQWS